MLIRTTKAIASSEITAPRDFLRRREFLERTGGLIFSQRVLLTLIDKGLDRQKAYEWVQRNAMKTWEEGADFSGLLKADSDVREWLSDGEIDTCFDLSVHLRHTDELFERVFGHDHTA